MKAVLIPTVPLLGLISPSMAFNKVDLPEATGPRIMVTDPFLASKETEFFPTFASGDATATSSETDSKLSDDSMETLDLSFKSSGAFSSIDPFEMGVPGVLACILLDEKSL